MNSKILNILLATLLITPVIAQEDLPTPGTTPESPFYGFKRAFEGLQLAIAFSNEEKVEKRLQFAEKRLAEAEAMAKRNKTQYVGDLVKEYEKNINQSNRIAERVRERNRERVTAMVANKTAKHLNVLDKVEEKVPEEGKRGIQIAKNVSIKGNQMALRGLARENPEKATEMAMGIAKGRLKRLNQSLEKNESKEIEKARKEYERYAEFGEQISSIAQEIGKNTTKVKELVENATAHHLTVLQKIYEKVPEQAKSGIQNAIEKTERGRERVTESLGKGAKNLSEEGAKNQTMNQTQTQNQTEIKNQTEAKNASKGKGTETGATGKSIIRELQESLPVGEKT